MQERKNPPTILKIKKDKDGRKQTILLNAVLQGLFNLQMESTIPVMNDETTKKIKQKINEQKEIEKKIHAYSETIQEFLKEIRTIYSEKLGVTAPTLGITQWAAKSDIPSVQDYYQKVVELRKKRDLTEKMNISLQNEIDLLGESGDEIIFDEEQKKIANYYQKQFDTSLALIAEIYSNEKSTHKHTLFGKVIIGDQDSLISLKQLHLKRRVQQYEKKLTMQMQEFDVLAKNLQSKEIDKATVEKHISDLEVKICRSREELQCKYRALIITNQEIENFFEWVKNSELPEVKSYLQKRQALIIEKNELGEENDLLQKEIEDLSFMLAKKELEIKETQHILDQTRENIIDSNAIDKKAIGKSKEPDEEKMKLKS